MTLMAPFQFSPKGRFDAPFWTVKNNRPRGKLFRRMHGHFWDEVSLVSPSWLPMVLCTQWICESHRVPNTDNKRTRLKISHYLRSHLLVLHSLVSCWSPSHFFPSPSGLGLLQYRFLICSPPPHVTGHLLHSPNSPHPPSTEENENRNILRIRTDGAKIIDGYYHEGTRLENWIHHTYISC